MPILHDVPFADYVRMPGVHFSTLKYMATSPFHYRRACDAERTDTPALRLGRLAHAMILTPDLPPDVALWDGPTKRGSEWIKFKAASDASGKLIVRPEELYAVAKMRAAVHASRDAMELIRDGSSEVTLEWSEEGPQGTWVLPCRARLDHLGPRGMVELKTTRRGTPRAWASEVARYAYHVQLAHYEAGLEDLGEVGIPMWWIVVEKSEPFDVCVYRVRRAEVEIGARLRWTWLQRVVECEASGRWPGVGGHGPLDFALPDWAATEGLDDVDTDGILEASDGDE